MSVCIRTSRSSRGFPDLGGHSMPLPQPQLRVLAGDTEKEWPGAGSLRHKAQVQIRTLSLIPRLAVWRPLSRDSNIWTLRQWKAAPS
ncbi:hypothetical protein Cadr_000004994 [Camelus dromedarius]|uniref:Uncharacterized protein n=1 Tax=Camelus dromedarius TaxID=9838 RepID=A0A5N4EBV9_CAMDR|nr:hypothetical protein Cadr_000004994 [Camelus dromedarius]